MPDAVVRRSTPGDWNRFEGIGTVERTHLARGDTLAFLLRLDDGGGEPCRLVVWPPASAGVVVTTGCRVWVKGTIRVEDIGNRKSLHYLQAQHLDVLKVPRKEAHGPDTHDRIDAVHHR